MNLRRLSLFVAVVTLSFTTSMLRAQWITDDRTESSKDRSADHPAAADAWYWGQRASGTGQIPGDAIQKAIEHRDAMRFATFGKQQKLGGRVAQAASTVTWSQVGPSNIGGRINTIAIDPRNANTAYVGSANGGVWKTADAGQSWSALTDNAQSLAMGALAIDPSDPNTIYAGTGELSQAVDTYSGYGILVSHDAGATWSTTGPINVGAYSRIIVDPKNSDIIYAAAGRSGGGLFRSTDHGKTWPVVEGGLPHGKVTDLALSMNGDAVVLYAGIAYLGVYRSMDGGESWTRVYKFNSMARIQLDASVTDWKRVAAISVYPDGSLDGFQGSIDGGQTWNSMVGNLGASLFQTGNSPAQGWYDILVRIDPSDPDHVVVGGISLWSSRNFGDSWTDNGRAYHGGIHPDQHAFEFAPSDASIAYAGNDGGFYTSANGGDTYNWSPAQMPITQFYVISTDQSGDQTYGGTQDNGTLVGTTGTVWDPLLGGDGGYVICDPADAQRLYITTPNYPYPAMIESGEYVDIGRTIASYGDSTSWINPLLLDTKNDILYYGSDHLSQSTNHGSSWSHGQSRIPDLTYIQSIAAFGDKLLVIAGTSGGHVYQTTDKGRRWKDISGNLPGRWVTSLHFAPSDSTTIYATVSGFGGGHVYRTTNGGTKWTNISGTLPDLPVNTLIADPQNSHVLYVGTDIGVFLSPDDGTTWVPYGAGLPNVSVTSLDIHQSNRTLVAGTHGRSIWEASLVNDLPGITTPTQRTIWTMGDAAAIGWHGMSSPVTLSISRDGGSHWSQIQSDVSGSTYDISEVRFAASQNALIKVSDGVQDLVSPLFQIVQRKTGENLKVLAELPYTLYDVAWDPDEQVLWGTNWSDNSTIIYKIDPDNGSVLDSLTLPASMRNLTGIKYDVGRKHFFVHQAITDFNSSWFEIEKNGTIVNHGRSQSAYGTGIWFKNDTLFLADRLTSGINRILESDANYVFTPLMFARSCLYGPRCIAYNAKLDRLMLAYTEFIGTSSSDARLTGSYVLFLNPYTGEETNAFLMQLGGEDVNIRGMEWDPRNGGNSAWVTYLDGTNSAKLVKITLQDGPSFTSGSRVLPTELAGAELQQNYPNPFNPSTVVPFKTPVAGTIDIRVLDNVGRVVLTTSRFESSGAHERRIDCENLPSGSYTYELRINGTIVAARRLTLMK